MPASNIPLGDGEQIVLTRSLALIPALPSFLLAILLFILPFIFLSAFPAMGPFIIFFLTFLLVVGILFFLLLLTQFARSSFLVTNKRVLYADQTGLSQACVSDAPLHAIEKIQIRGNFFTARMGYGDIRIFVKGKERPLIVYGIRSPKMIKGFLEELCHL